MTIELTPEQEQILQTVLRQGRFRSVDEALDQAIHSLAATSDAPRVAGDRRTPAEAAAHIRVLRKGNVLPAGMTIRGLINHGRA